MNITYFPFEPFRIEEAKVNIIDLGNSKMYFEFCQGLRGLADTLRISDDNLELLSLNSQVSWYGDLMLSVDLDKLFLRKIQQHIIELMTDEQQVATIDETRKLVNEVMDVSFLLDVPLEVNTVPSLEKVVKFVGLSYQADLNNNPYEILKAVMKTHSELGIKKTIVLTNVSHYLTQSQFGKLIEYAQDISSTIVIIEFSECNRMEKFRDCCYYYADEDFVDWRHMD